MRWIAELTQPTPVGAANDPEENLEVDLHQWLETARSGLSNRKEI